MSYYTKIEGKPGFFGPWSAEEICAQLRAGTLTRSDEFLEAGTGETYDTLKQRIAWTEIGATFTDAEILSASLPADSSISGVGRSDSVARSVMNRYRDAYLVARTTTAIGGTVKVIGIVLASLVVLVGIASALNDPFNMEAGIGALRLGIIFGAVLLGLIVGIPVYVLGILVSAHGQVLKATLDSAVHSTPFLADDQKLKVMSLP